MDKYRVQPGKRVVLKSLDPNEQSQFEGNKAEGKTYLQTLNNELAALQEILFAQNQHKVLVILQGMDTSGKDGTIQHVFNGVNPQGVKIANFKVPTEIELAHDYLWRIHKQTPRKGEIVIFNRSHYEDVLVVRVHKLVHRKVWSRRFHQINSFERMLSEEGTTILKFFLNIDQDEQKQRFQARLDDPNKQWKFRRGDLEERDLWSDYMRAYEDVLNKTSTQWAPWYIIPANRKWYRNIVVGTVLIDTLKSLKLEYPNPEADLSGIVID
jgi:PPK2 family polyphosphate:nucleotide phosphotransferase